MFITLEGIDGSGKSSAIEILKKHIINKYDINNFVFTREPGGSNIKDCENIRKILLNKEAKIKPEIETMLYLTSRRIHVEKLIKPSIESKKIVICDRFYDSSIAYQGAGRNLGEDFVEDINLKILKNLKPDYTFYFKIDFETFKKRMKNNKELDRIESETQEFFNKVINSYNKISEKENKRFIVIDATQPIEEVHKQFLKKIDEILKIKT